MQLTQFSAAKNQKYSSKLAQMTDYNIHPIWNTTLQIFYNNKKGMHPNNTQYLGPLDPSNRFPAFNWTHDQYKPQEQLFSKAFQYCTQILTLSNDLFTGEMQLFGAYKSSINISGGMEWHNPTFSLVLNLVHNIDDQALDQHILLYHGVKNNRFFQQIFKDRLKAGPGQAYRGQKGKNPKLTVPNGVYGSQYLNVTVGGYVDHTFPMVIQFATPSAVMTSSKNIFVVDQKVSVTPIKLVFPFNGVNRSDMFQ